MRIAVTGAKGMFGSRVLEELSRTDDVTGVDIDELDVTDAAVVASFYRETEPELVVHCAAFTDVDGSERVPEKVFAINALGTRNVCMAAAERGAAVCYISTDYVFDGTKRKPYTELDHPGPLNVYGESKLAGERYVSHLLERFFIVRSSGLFGPGGKNFVDTILSKARNGAPLRVVNDQTGGPTYTVDLARGVAAIVHSDQWGVYHVSNSGSCTWFDFAQEIVRLGAVPDVTLLPVTTEAYGAAAARPRYTVLSNSTFNKRFGSPLRGWQEALSEYLLSKE